MKLVREEWITVLPPERRLDLDPAALSTARKFSNRGITGRGEDTSWTDTPADRERKRKERESRMQEKKQQVSSSWVMLGIRSNPTEKMAALQQKSQQISSQIASEKVRSVCVDAWMGW